MDHVIAQLREQVLDAAQQQHTILIEGGGTKSFYGNPALDSLDSVALKLSALHGIINYQPTELVVTAWAGTPLQEVVDTLAASAQMLAFHPPSFGAQATLGGSVAAGLAGPGR